MAHYDFMVSRAWPGLAKFENDTKATIFFFVYVFACLSKCSVLNSLQGNWEESTQEMIQKNVCY